MTIKKMSKSERRYRKSISRK